MTGARRLLIALLSLAVGGALVAAAAWLTLDYQRRELADAIHADVRAQVQVEAAMVAALARNDPRAGDELFSGITLPVDRRLTVIAADGRVLFDSQADRETMENHNDRPEVVAARASGSGSSQRLSHTLAVPFIYAATALPDGRVVRVAERLSTESEFERSLFAPVAVATVLVVGLVAALLLVVQLRSGARFRELKAVSESFARGDFTRRAAIVGGGSFGAIGAELNRLGERLQVSLAALAEQRRLLDSALDALDEGICCVDQLDRVVYANPAYRQLAAGGAEVTGQLFYEHLPAAGLEGPLAITRQAESREGSRAVELEHRRRHLRAVVVPAGSGLTVLVLHDLTESRSLEQARRDFMAAVSHEFKTPLTAIVGYSESLAQGGLEDPATAREFVAGIARQTERLTDLVHDVLTLSRLEQGGWEVRPEEIDLESFVDTLIEQFRPMANLKQVNLQQTIGGPATVVGDQELLRQLIGNLLSNAIRYNRPHGSVLLHIDGNYDHLRIAVQDTGPGIPAEHQTRIFERFYRIDAHRSRQTGGTGLGLAIVKQLLDLMGGTIAMHSDANGTRFDLSLPRRMRVHTASAVAPPREGTEDA